MLPSTDLKASAPRTIAFSVLNSPAHPYRCRRFACPLAGANARLAEKRGLVTPSFRGTCTPNLLPVRLAHQILAIAFAQGIRVREDADLAELLSHVDVDSEIPLEAFAAVAEILAYVYRANGSLPPPTDGPGEPDPPTAITAP